MNVLKNKKILIVIGCSAIFICAAIFVFLTYVKPKLNKQYVANKEFIKTDSTVNNQADLYFFYTSWCPHCKSAKPTWEKLVNKYNNKKVNVKNVSIVAANAEGSEVEKELANDLNAQGYPTIKALNNNEVNEHSGGRDLESLENFVKEQCN